MITNPNLNKTSNANAHNGAIHILRKVLKERKEAIECNPELVTTDMLTQTGIYYDTRPKLIVSGINFQRLGKQFRKNLIRKIEKICEKELGVTREEIGIFAQDRTFLYFRGLRYSVGYRNLLELVNKGTDIIMIEKEGMAEVLRPFADKSGIAVLNTIGFVARYASRLSKAAEESGSHIAMITDFDVSGLLIARQFPSIYRIGIDFETIDHFPRLRMGDVEERYFPLAKHIKGLRNMGPAEGEDSKKFYDNLEYIKQKRIEIDSVVRALNRTYEAGPKGNKRFWDFVIKKLVKKFPTRDYNRSIDVPDYVDPDILLDLARALRTRIEILIENKVQETKEHLRSYKGL